jgi:hypothetical protein
MELLISFISFKKVKKKVFHLNHEKKLLKQNQCLLHATAGEALILKGHHGVLVSHTKYAAKFVFNSSIRQHTKLVLASLRRYTVSYFY